MTSLEYYIQQPIRGRYLIKHVIDIDEGVLENIYEADGNMWRFRRRVYREINPHRNKKETAECPICKERGIKWKNKLKEEILFEAAW